MTPPRAQPRAVVVADLGFGDSGKGLVVDALVRRLDAKLVVRFNGGAQAGHNVVTPDGRHHTFSQFGAGTFNPGVRTFLSRHMAVHPAALLLEARRLAKAGVTDALERLSVSRGALVTTPFHQAAGRVRELARGGARHGSCGAGAGETVRDSLRDPGALRVGDLLDRRALKAKAAALQQRKRRELDEVLGPLSRDAAIKAEMRALEDAGMVDAWLEEADVFRSRVSVVDDGELGRLLGAETSVIFEGAQGVLLDEAHGFHPHTTWSTCTFDNAVELLKSHGCARPIERLGVIRSYLVRHGPGPFPTEDAAAVGPRREPHNGDGPWQGPVRTGWPDWMLLQYALAACKGADSLALTHLDALDGRESWRAAVAYERPGAAPLEALSSSAGLDLSRRESLTAALFEARPVYREWPREAETTAAERYVRALEERFALPVSLTSTGPSAAAVRFRERR